MIKEILFSISIIFLLFAAFEATQKKIDISPIKNTNKVITKKISKEFTKFVLPKKFLPPPKKRWGIKKEWIPPKNLRDCMNGTNIIDNETIRCRNGYYIDIRVPLN